jgi:hypothetical protein
MRIEDIRNLCEPVVVNRGPFEIVLDVKTNKLCGSDSLNIAYNALSHQGYAIEREQKQVVVDIARSERELAALDVEEDALQIFIEKAPPVLELVNSDNAKARKSGADMLQQLSRMLLDRVVIPTQEELDKRGEVYLAKSLAQAAKLEELNLQAARNQAERLLFFVEGWDLTEGPEGDETPWPVTSDNLISLRHAGMLSEMLVAVEAKVFGE